MAIREQLIEKRLARLRQFLKLVELHNRNNASGREVVIGL